MNIFAIKVIATIALAAFAGWSYREGGSQNGFGHWFRMFGVGLSMFFACWIWLGWSNWNFLSAGLSWAESTYFKKKGSEVVWWNWLLIGAVFSFVPMPSVWANGKHWVWFVLTGTCMPVLVWLWCGVLPTGKNPSWSEAGRGAMQILRFLLIGSIVFFIRN